MSGTAGGSGVLLPAVLAGAAVALLLVPARTTGRLRGVLLPDPAARRADRLPRRRPGRRQGVASGDGAGPGRAGPERAAGPGRGAGTPRAPVVACLLGGVAVALLTGGVAGAVLGLALAAGGPQLLARLEPAAVRQQRERRRADLPLALDLLAACLVGGAGPEAAARAVGSAVPGPCGAAFAQVAAALAVGSAPTDAWAALLDDDDPLAAATVRAMVRAGEGGAPVAAAVAGLTRQAARAAVTRGQEAAERAGVLAVAPLGLCFLPAFVLLGVVPVVAGLLGPLLSGL